MQVLITGPGGFVGGALSTHLLERGERVRVLLRDGREAASLEAQGAEVARGDLADPTSLAKAARGCDVVFHTASESNHHASPRVLSWVNVAGTENVIHAARAAGAGRVVHLSCADATLLPRHRVHWKEDVFLGGRPLGACACSKLLAEELALQASSPSMPIAALRPAWLWGPGDTLNLPGLCREAREGGVHLFGSGETFLSTTYIDNLVDALVAAATREDIGGNAFHVADGEFHYAREFFSMLCDRLGLGSPRRGVFALSYARAWLEEQRGGEGPWRCDVARRARSCLLDCSRSASVLDLTPRVSVEQGLDALAAWVDAQGGPAGVEKLQRRPAGDEVARHHEQVADALAQ